ncbi:MAG: BolA family protein [Litorimonas sp.]
MSDLLAQIDARLRAAFAPTRLSVEDESHLHAGHGGAAEHAAEFGATEPSHIHVDIQAPAFSGQSRLARHRAVMDAMGDTVERLHAVRLTIGDGEAS